MEPRLTAGENSQRWMRVIAQVETMLEIAREQASSEDLLVQDVEALLQMILVANEEYQMDGEEDGPVLRAMVRSIEALFLMVLQRAHDTHQHLHDQVRIDWQNEYIPGGVWTIPATSPGA